ncbi:MAG TPA: TetR/AcrR family transcriptional regulator [Alphaproteobacteria bacterium]|nr:TetR/AcrR family transcriptional regulator [Alphaproteobacteria bacterium]
MVQVKKRSVHDAIVRNADALFSAHGYHETTLADIAKATKVGVGSIYSYFPSKLALLYQVYRPWLLGHIDRLERSLAGKRAPREKLRLFLLCIWRDIPARNTGLANSLMEALASADPREGKPDDLLRVTERRLTVILETIVPRARQHFLEGDLLAHLLLMAYDGFVINRRLGDTRDIGALIETVCDMILGPPARRQSARPPQSRRSRNTA